MAKENYAFISVEDYRQEHSQKVIINRHDLDSSVHRAAKISAIEKEEGVSSTYFVYLHSSFYNAYEKGIVRLLKDIVSNGHEIGIHYEPWFYGIDIGMDEEFERHLKLERDMLEALLEVQIGAFSFHNPDRGGWTAFSDDTVCGLINMYSGYFKEHYGYCSDSDGHWRYRRLFDVLSEAGDIRLQILTHPEWWTPSVMKPRDRILRCAQGRLNSSMRQHDETMSEMGRVNDK